jgi:hypothetical protein
VDEFGLEVIDAKTSITDQQRLMRKVIAQHVQTSGAETIDDQLA